MACARCNRDVELDRFGWCQPCDRDFDLWSRRYATDILYAVLCGGFVVAGVAIGVPLLGASWLVSALGVFAGFGTIVGSYRGWRRRRRRQFLRGAAVPRAYLPSKT